MVRNYRTIVIQNTNIVCVLTVGLDAQEVYTPRYTSPAVMRKPTVQVDPSSSSHENYIDIACYHVAIDCTALVYNIASHISCNLVLLMVSCCW